LAQLLYAIPGIRTKVAASAGLVAILLSYTKVSHGELKQLDNSWQNTTAVAQFLSSHVQTGDTILTETGPPVMLASFNNNFPAHITTFDWFEYQKLSGLDAYAAAVTDGYFSYIEVTDESLEKESLHQEVNNIVSTNISNNYRLAYRIGPYQIYERKY
jgi:hypothetical protein